MSFTVYRSSAGSGKTFSLVREYLKMVLKHPPGFRHILAITFTNKAANEMKERVMKALRDLSRSMEITPEGSSRQLQLSLLEETGMGEEELSRRAGEALSLILHHYSEFSIGTIDSFSHRIIRAFAHDFGLPVSFAVELEAEELLTAAVDLLLERAGTDKELTRLLVSFLESRMEEDKGWNIDRLLVSFATLLMDEEGEEQVRKLSSLTLDDFHRISKQLHGRIRETEQLFKELGEEALELIYRHGIPSSAFYFGKTGIPGYFEYLVAGRMDKLEPNTRVTATIEEDKWLSQKASASDAEAIHRIKPELQEIYHRVEALKEAQSADYFLAKLLIRTIYPLAVLNEIGRMLDGFKRQHNLVHISEFNSRIARIVMGEPVPFIYERLGEKVHHVLIDEFQDTSRLQWLNFVPLIENALAGGHFNLVVGDGKQAIYRWRNGDVTQFTSLPALPGRDENPLIRQRETLFTRYFTEHQLDSNYRSLPEIVNFNNRFFRWLSQHLDPGLQDVYRELEQKSGVAGQGGYIHLDVISGVDPELNYTDQTIHRADEIIRQLQEGGYALEDIAILCRTNRQAGRIARELILRRIDVVSSESLLLSFSPEVRFVTELIRFLFEPANTIIQATVAGYLFYAGKLKRERDGLHMLLAEIGSAAHPGDHLLKILVRNGLELDKDHLLSLPVYDLCEKVIRTFGLNRKADPYIQFFLDAVVAFVEKEKHNAAGFLEWWDQHQSRLSIVVPEGVDAVRIMTIHKAKGLEFPVVLFPFADESLKKTTKEYLWIELPPEDKTGLKTAFLPAGKQMLDTPYAHQFEEEQASSMLDLANLLYVAMTRPAEQLYILTAPPPANMEELKSLPAFFAGFLQSTGVWEEEKRSYEFGVFTAKQAPSGRLRVAVRSLSSLPSADWRQAIQIRQRAPEFWDMEDPSGKVDFGRRVHEILAGIRIAADQEESFKRALLSGLISREEEPHIRKMVGNVVSHPLLTRYFDADVGIRNEPEILTPGGEASRPDRIVFDGEEVMVIDYKTGKKSQAHRKQIEHYTRLLQEMGYQNVRKLLVYLGDEVEIVEV